MDRKLEQQVWARAKSCCEYCRLPANVAETPFQIDHVIACKHGGRTKSSNLALSCFYCNSYKGPNLSGIDPKSGKLTRLFHPREDSWDDHFRWNGAILVGRTDVGRTTIAVLNMNHPDAVAKREALLQEAIFPPDLR